MKNKNNQSLHVVENRVQTLTKKTQILRIAAVVAMFGVSFSAATNSFATDAKCSYKDSNTFLMTCEKQDTTAPETETQPAAKPATQPAAEPAPTTQPAAEAQPAETEQSAEPAAQAEDVAVPIVGNTDESYVEPLGETASWYPEQSNYDNVVNYQYGKSAEFVASLTNPEEGITASDVVLIVIIVLSLMAIVATTMVLAGRAVASRTTTRRKDFIKK